MRHPVYNINFSVDLALNKLNHPVWKAFHKKYTEHELPTVTSARRVVPHVYKATVEKIRNEIGDEDYIWFSIDETTDLNGNPTFTFVVGRLNTVGHRVEVHHDSREKKDATNVMTFFKAGMKVLKPMLHITNGKFLIINSLPIIKFVAP